MVRVPLAVCLIGAAQVEIARPAAQYALAIGESRIQLIEVGRPVRWTRNVGDIEAVWCGERIVASSAAKLLQSFA